MKSNLIGVSRAQLEVEELAAKAARSAKRSEPQPPLATRPIGGPTGQVHSLARRPL